MKQYAIGIDVGGTAIKIGLFDINGRLIYKCQFPTNRNGGSEGILADIKVICIEMAHKNGIDFKDIIGAGMGVPGTVNKDGFLGNGSANIGWGRFNPATELGRLLGIPVKVANDANVAALGEQRYGVGNGYPNMVMVTLGTGIGGGIIVEGNMVTGFSGAAGEIGHICVNNNETIPCGCGRYGCLEQYASATGIVRVAKEHLEKNKMESVLKLETLTAKKVFEALKSGDSLAKSVVEEFADYLGRGLAAVAMVTNPEMIVIGGGVSKAGNILLAYLEPAFQKYARREGVKFSIAKLGNDAGIYGAVEMVLSERKLIETGF